MAEFLFNDVIETSVTSLIVSTSTGTITESTSPYKMATRSVMDRYIFTKTGNGTITISLTTDDLNYIQSIGVLNYNGQYTLNNIKVYAGASLLVTETTPETVTRSLYVNGETTTYSYYELATIHQADKIDITYNVISNGLPSYFGKVIVSNKYTLKLKPLADISNIDTSRKDRSKGGQVYTSAGVIYKEMKLSTPPLTHDDAIITVDNFNIIVGTHKAFLLIPDKNMSLIFYGTQKTPSSYKLVKAKENSKWHFECSFNLEEEL